MVSCFYTVLVLSAAAAQALRMPSRTAAFAAHLPTTATGRRAAAATASARTAPVMAAALPLSVGAVAVGLRTSATVLVAPAAWLGSLLLSSSTPFVVREVIAWPAALLVGGSLAAAAAGTDFAAPAAALAAVLVATKVSAMWVSWPLFWSTFGAGALATVSGLTPAWACVGGSMLTRSLSATLPRARLAASQAQLRLSAHYASGLSAAAAAVPTRAQPRLAPLLVVVGLSAFFAGALPSRAAARGAAARAEQSFQRREAQLRARLEKAETQLRRARRINWNASLAKANQAKRGIIGRWSPKLDEDE